MADIRLATDDDLPQWNRYVLDHPQGTVFHLNQWNQAVADAYRHKPLHLLAEEGGKITGLLPLFRIKSVFVGRVLVSVPYATYGGILADDDPTAGQLLERANQLAAEEKANYLELRHREKRNLDVPIIDRYDTFRKDLPEDPETVLPDMPKKARAAVRKGLEQCTTQTFRGGEGIDTVYGLYAYNLRRLGSPNYRKSFFRALAGHYGQDCVVTIVQSDGRPVSAVVSYLFRDEVVPYFSGSIPQSMDCNANNVMYYELMKWAVEQGLKVFDFNRTRKDNRGPHAFKRHQGFEPQPLHYQIQLQGDAQMPNLTPSNSKFKLAGNLWKKMPLCITRPLGACLTKWIP